MSTSTGEERVGNPYIALFRTRAARRFSAAGFVGRMPMSMAGLAIVFLVSAVTGSYGLAGGVSATNVVSYGLVAPRVGRLVDRFGQRRVLVPLALGNALASALFITCGLMGWPLWTLFAAALATGVTTPPLGSMVRARWSHLLRSSPQLMTAFSFESVVDEMIFVTGPLLVTLLATGVHPVAGMLATATLTFVGTTALGLQGGSEPPSRPRSRHDDGRVLRVAGLPTLVGVYLGLGALFGGVELATVAFTAERGHPGMAGWLLAVYAAGSGTAGLWYGTRQWRAPLERRFMISLVGIAGGVAAFAMAPNPWAMLPIMAVAGLPISPTLIAGYAYIQERVPSYLLTEGMTWLSTAVGIGVALGAPITGRLIDAAGARFGYLFALACGAVAVAIVLAGARSMRTPSTSER